MDELGEVLRGEVVSSEAIEDSSFGSAVFLICLYTKRLSHTSGISVSRFQTSCLIRCGPSVLKTVLTDPLDDNQPLHFPNHISEHVYLLRAPAMPIPSFEHTSSTPRGSIQPILRTTQPSTLASFVLFTNHPCLT